MSNDIQQFFPVLATRNNHTKAAWLEYENGDDGVALKIGNLKNEELIPSGVLAQDLKHFLEPKITFINDKTYMVALSCDDGFKLKAWLCNTETDDVEKTIEINDGNEKVGEFDFANHTDAIEVVWENWDKSANAALKVRKISSQGELGNIRQLTSANTSVSWPSAAMCDDTLWVSYSVPNESRTGYDCILTAEENNKITSWKLNVDNSLYNLYPELSVDKKQQLWISWVKETDQEYYHLIKRMADSTYCCSQDEDSRARRKILWNATEPVVMKLDKKLDNITATRYAPTDNARGEDENQTIHYPSLHFTINNMPIMAFDRIKMNRFESCYGVIGQGSEEFFRKETECNKVCLLPRPTNNRTFISDNKLIMLQETAKVEKGKRAYPNAKLEVKRYDLVSYTPEFVKLSELIFESYELPSQVSVKPLAAFGNIHVHTEMSSCRRDTQQAIDFSYRWGKDLMSQQFIAITDHIEDISPAHWRYCLSLVDFFNFPGEYVAIAAYEWAKKYPNGHMNVLFPNYDAALAGHFEDNITELEKLWDFLKDTPSMTIAHHTATFPFRREWDMFNKELEPLVEIYQDRRGNYEFAESPWQPGDACPEQGQEHKEPDGFVVNALKRGYKLGFCSGGDHMGLSMTGIFSTDFTSESIFNDFKKRNCFAVSLPDVAIDIKASAGESCASMGETLSVNNQQLEISIKAQANQDMDYVALVHNGEEVCRIDVDSKNSFESKIMIDKPVDYIYARVVLKNKNIAWSSPIWFKTK